MGVRWEMDEWGGGVWIVGRWFSGRVAGQVAGWAGVCLVSGGICEWVSGQWVRLCEIV